MRFVGSISKINLVSRLIGALLVSAGTFAGDNYLAAIGPAPIRFREAKPEYDPAKVLPPLKMADAPATNVVETVTQSEPIVRPAETTPVATEPTATPQPPAAVPVEIAPQPQPGMPESRTESNQMTPQMLLRYFSKDGSREVFVPAPLEFTPPPSSGTRSSAVYNSPPAK